MTVISLLTDFGSQDGFVGVMKGVIWDICPDAHIADLTHEIPPQSVLQGALILAQSYTYFPEGSVHVAVVDPGVGTARRGIAARVAGHYFVAPDNGLLTVVLQEAQKGDFPVELVELNRPEYWLKEVSRSFHGRDVFAPVGAHLANGVPLEKIGSPAGEVVLLDPPQPRRTPAGWEARVILVDHFGNLITDLDSSRLDPAEVSSVACQGQTAPGIVDTFAEGRPGELIAMFDSSGRLSLCVVNGSAAARLETGAGARVLVRLRS
jgi:S-adenosylmethionine hydrolase